LALQILRFGGLEMRLCSPFKALAIPLLVSFGSLGVPVNAQEAGEFVCLTPQVTDYDRERNKLKVNDFDNTGGKVVFNDDSTDVVTIQDFQTLYGDDRWTKSDSLSGSAGKIRIGVAFLDGDQSKKGDVIKYASEWLVESGATNIEFVWNNSEKNHIRVTFKSPRNENHSLIGRQAAQITDHSVPTMVLGAVRASEPEERRAQVIRHEFGHALGMRHELLHPTGGIEWNKEVVEAFYKKRFNWDPPQVKAEVFDHYKDVSYMCLGAKQFDPHSIMMYPVLAGWAKNLTWDVNNTEIVPTDLACVHSLYHE
jgi:hypothetical protein